MGRHRKQTPATISRSSVLALTGLVPASVVAVNATAAVNTDPTAATVQMNLPGADTTDPNAAITASEQPVVDENAVHAMAKQSRSVAPEIKTVARPADRPRADLPQAEMGIPGIAHAAYTSAEQILAEENPECGISWTTLAGIGRVESTHMYDGRADAEGNALEPVFGPTLDGSLAGNNVIADSDGGALDGIAGYDRAVGPMQFLPETWARYGADGNGDGIADPQNYYDATLTAGKYLCDGGLNMRDPSQQTRAILRYNHSMAYVANVMAWANSYNTGVVPHPSELPRIH
ncbi:lytic transglycosylase domain-containing protein [Nocardia paucivorans]|uniref:lytic transglycosylase domain-containing protein n=1 Tax=Nocardia paucivorans TaxID=114259 RepID=UPI0002D785DC|nr:lytic murein transglycosylase [Nocardia paucivorans]